MTVRSGYDILNTNAEFRSFIQDPGHGTDKGGHIFCAVNGNGRIERHSI